MNRKTFFIALLLLTAMNISCKTLLVSESSDPKEAVTSAFERLKQTDQFSYVNKSKNGRVAEFYRGKQGARLKVNDKEMETETIVIGSDAYSRMGTAPWAKSPAEKISSEIMDGWDLSKRDTAKMSDFKFVEKDTIDGKDAFIFSFKVKALNEQIENVWISADTGLPLKLTVKDALLVEKQPELSEMYVVMFDHSKRVDLKPPI